VDFGDLSYFATAFLKPFCDPGLSFASWWWNTYAPHAVGFLNLAQTQEAVAPEVLSLVTNAGGLGAWGAGTEGPGRTALSHAVNTGVPVSWASRGAGGSLDLRGGAGGSVSSGMVWEALLVGSHRTTVSKESAEDESLSSILDALPSLAIDLGVRI